MHAILTLHDKIHTGELLKRRETTGTGETATGAGIMVQQRDGQTAGLAIRS